jgi:hypothetical protein
MGDRPETALAGCRGLGGAHPNHLADLGAVRRVGLVREGQHDRGPLVMLRIVLCRVCKAILESLLPLTDYFFPWH